MSAAPEAAASNASNAGAISPAPNTFTVNRPSVPVVIASAMRCEATPRPGNFFGQPVTILSSRRPWA